MSKRMMIIGLVLTGLTVSAVYLAKSGPPRHRGGKDMMRLLPVLATLDANGDRVISADELNAAPAMLRKLDKNGDGKLTRDELRPNFQPQQRGGDTAVVELATEELISELLEFDEPNSWSRFFMRTFALSRVN